MPDREPTLQPLLAHLYGSVFGRVLAEAAAAGPGDRVIILNAEPTGPDGWALPDKVAIGTGTEGDSPADPLPVIDFVQWRGPAEFRQVAVGWHVLLGFPPFGQQREEDTLTFLEVAREAAHPSARALFILPATLVSRHSTVIRQALLLTGRVRSITFATARSASPKPGLPFHPSMPVALVRWDPGGVTSEPATVGTAEAGAAFSVKLSAKQPWTLAALDPERAQKIQRWASVAGAKRLEDVAPLVRAARGVPVSSRCCTRVKSRRAGSCARWRPSGSTTRHAMARA